MSAEKDEPSLRLEWGDKVIEMSARNSTLYTFLGKSGIQIGQDIFEIDRSALDHVWVATAKDKGIYFWAEHNPQEYEPMAEFIIEHSFPAVLNARSVASMDIQAWVQEVDERVESFATNIPNELDEK